MRVILGDKYKLKTKEYKVEAWEEIINYTATIVDHNPVANFGLERSSDGYVSADNTSQLYAPLPAFNSRFTDYKYKQTLNGDDTVTVSIIINTLETLFC